MMPNIVRGGDTGGLLRYLVGPGRANEHSNPTVVTGSPDVEFQWAGQKVNASDVASMTLFLETQMNRHHVVMTGPTHRFNEETGESRPAGIGKNHVWHCSLSLHPDEPKLSVEKWAQIAQDFMTEMGLNGGQGSSIEWVAIHHGESKNGGDHIHIAAVLVDDQGRKIFPRLDYVRSQKAANVIEHRYGLAVVESREHGRGSICETPTELNRAGRQSESLTERARLDLALRAALAKSSNESEFVQNVRQAGVIIRPRYARGGTDAVVGYSVALRTRSDIKPVWFAGSKIARDLSLERIRAELDDSPHSRLDALNVWPTQAQRRVMGMPSARMESWREMTDIVDQTLKQMDAIPVGDREGLARISRETAGVFATLGELGGPDAWRYQKAARALSRTAQTKQFSHTNYQRNKMLVRSLGSVARAGMRPDARTAASVYRLLNNLARTYRRHQQPVTAGRLTSLVPAGATNHETARVMNVMAGMMGGPQTNTPTLRPPRPPRPPQGPVQGPRL